MASIRIDNYLRDQGFFDTMAEDVRRGLTSTPKILPPKYFYDDVGSELFERITELPEYYPCAKRASSSTRSRRTSCAG